MSAPTHVPPGAAAPPPSPPSAPRGERLLGLRVAVAAGALILLLSLFAQWAYDRRPEPDVALSAWRAFAVTDLVLAALAAAALAGAALPRRAGAIIALAAGGLALLVVAREFVVSAPRRGGRIAALGALLVAGAAAARLVPPRLPATGGARSAFARADGIAHRVVESPVVVVLLGTVLAAVTWPLGTLQPGGGTDGSWVAALHLAAQRGLDFGTELVFTYGPLGYLTVPRLVTAETATPGFVYVAVVHLALAITLLWAAKHSFGLPLGLVVTVLALDLLRIVSPEETTQLSVVAVVFALCLAALRDPRIGAWRGWHALVAAGGAVAAAHALIKLNTGLLCALLIAGTAVAAAPPRRRLSSATVFSGAFLVALAALWALLDQGVTDLPAYLGRSYEVIAGYGEYQYTEEGGREWEYLAAALVVLVLTGTALTATRSWARVPRYAALGLGAAYLFTWFKQGFVRHDGHSLAFFAAALAAGLALGWPARPRFPALVAVSVLFVALLGAARPVPAELHEPRAAIAALREQLRLLGDPEPYIATQRDELRRALELDAETLALLRGRTVHVFPGEASVAFTQPEIRWRPLPVFQGYQAYTDDLDDLNADVLAGRDAPERILRTEELSPWENPGAVRELFCRYRQLRAGPGWQVLARGPDRCGAPRSLGRASTRLGAPVRVPAPRAGEAVMMVVHGLEIGGAERLRSLLWKPYDRSLLFDGAEHRRIAVQLADEPSFVRVAPDVDYPAPFAVGAERRLLQVVMTGNAIISKPDAEGRRPPWLDRPVEVEFLALPVTDPAVVP